MRLLFLVLPVVFMSLQVHAQRNVIYGDVQDFVTGKVMTDVQVVLKNAQGIPMDTMYTGHMGQVSETPNAWLFRLGKESADYLVSFSYEGYEGKEITVKYRPSGRRSLYQYPTVRLQRRKEQVLNEAVVKATRVMLYTSKDTIIFNADAFQLAEGSMLDALVKQMPGVELKDDGRIYVNGKYVESLLLNGDDFFKGNNNVLLDNLPSYMVHQVKVYEKSGDMSKFAGRNMNDKEYVMDVRLKKQYSIGWLGNAEGGYGSEDRYLARLFALRFTPQSRVSVYGNINNVNESRKPGSNGDWSPSNETNGQDVTRNFGLDYQVKDRRKRWELSGNASLSHRDHDGVTQTAQTSFLPLGDAYRKTVSLQSECNTELSTLHSFLFNWKRGFIRVQPGLGYRKWDNRNQYAGIGLTQNLFDRKEWLDSMMQGVVSSSLWNYMLNRSLSQTMMDGRRINGNLRLIGMQRFKNNDDILQVEAHATYNRSKTHDYSHDLYEYKKADASIAEDFRNRFSLNHPNSNDTYYVKTSYWLWFPFNMAIVPSYRYWGARQHKDYATYRLDSQRILLWVCFLPWRNICGQWTAETVTNISCGSRNIREVSIFSGKVVWERGI